MEIAALVLGIIAVLGVVFNFILTMGTAGAIQQHEKKRHGGA